MAGWAQSVKDMANWFQNNIHTYQGQPPGVKSGRSYAGFPCPLVGGHNVRDDCSGFVSGCLMLAGINTSGAMYSSADFSVENSSIGQILKEKGWQAMPFDKSALREWDIYSANASGGSGGGHHHVEICAGPGMTYSWGSVHDTERGGMPSRYCDRDYNIIWRCPDCGAVSGGMGGSYVCKYSREDQQIHNFLRRALTIKQQLINIVTSDAMLNFDERAYGMLLSLQDGDDNLFKEYEKIMK